MTFFFPSVILFHSYSDLSLWFYSCFFPPIAVVGMRLSSGFVTVDDAPQIHIQFACTWVGSYVMEHIDWGIQIMILRDER